MDPQHLSRINAFGTRRTGEHAPEGSPILDRFTLSARPDGALQLTLGLTGSGTIAKGPKEGPQDADLGEELQGAIESCKSSSTDGRFSVASSLSQVLP